MRTLKDLEEIAKTHAWKLNSDPKVVNMILTKENIDYERLGHYYCPCKKLKTIENVCPCKNAQKEIDEHGHCHCMLYFQS